jgi:acyl carrier protein
MPMTDIADRVKDILAEECDADRAALVDDARLEDVGISSVDMVQVIFAIEEEFGVSIGENDMGLEVETVGEVTTAIARIVAEQT